MEHIDHGLDGGAFSGKTASAAKAYLDHQKLMLKMKATDVQEEPTEEPATQDQETTPAPTAWKRAAQKVDEQPHSTSAPASLPQKQEDDDQVIKIPNKHAMFEIAYPDFESGLTVVLRARDINLEEDSLSILMDDSVSLKMPKWKPLYIKIYDRLAGEIVRKVVWGGGTHSFGKVKHLSFIIVTDDGKES